jgi:hypothetical protein
MKLILRSVSLFFGFLAPFAGSAIADPIAPAPSIGYFEAINQEAPPVVGEQYYTRHCFMHEKSVSMATNYWRGTLVPINTRVVLVALDDDKIKLRVVDSGQVIKIENVLKFTKRDTATIAKNLLTRTPVPIERFDADTAAAIKAGKLKLGMTKEQVVMTRGYPPGHKTASLDLDSWKYWPSRLVMETVVFKNGVLIVAHGAE